MYDYANQHISLEIIIFFFFFEKQLDHGILFKQLVNQRKIQ